MNALSLQAAAALPDQPSSGWDTARFLTCSVLPVRVACNLSCKFCFSKSSISALEQERSSWTEAQLENYFACSRAKGASRLVITGGGEPLLRPELVQLALRVGNRFFSEIALFTNGVFLTRELAHQLADQGLSYICFSRHHFDEEKNRSIMGEGTVSLEEFFQNVPDRLKVRATCVLCSGFIEERSDIERYMRVLAGFGVREFTFKHTYVAYEHSLFRRSSEDQWAECHQVNKDPFPGEGTIVAALPWGPQIKKIGELQVCYYYEPTPAWELEHQLCRSINLLADGKIYASLEDQRSLLLTLQP